MLKLKIQVNCDTTVVSPSVSEGNVKLFIKKLCVVDYKNAPSSNNFLFNSNLNMPYKALQDVDLCLLSTKFIIQSFLTLHCTCSLVYEHAFHEFQLIDFL